jgi:hypothetical protein
LKLRRLSKNYRNCWFPKASTTTLKTDWCAKNQGQVTVVVDVELQGLGGEVFGIGEVKGDGEGLYQLLAAMQACRQTQGTWPVGFVADKAYLHLVEAQERCGRVTLNIAKYASDNLMQVLSFVEQLLIIAVDSISIEYSPAMSQLTLSSSSDSEEEIRERVRRLEAEMKELRKEVKGVCETLTQLATRGRFD